MKKTIYYLNTKKRFIQTTKSEIIMKLNIKVLFVILLSCLAFSSCSDDLEASDIKTEGELIGEEISKLINEEGIYKATTYLVRHNYSATNVSYEEYQEYFEVKGQIIKVGKTYYNLSKLIKYEIETEEQYGSEYEIKVLELSFEGFGE